VFNTIETELDTEGWYTARLEFLGEEMLAEIDGEISLGSSPTFTQVKTKCGFGVFGDAAQFRNLTIWEATANPTWEETGPAMRKRYQVD
jgi:hypothetical protein